MVNVAVLGYGTVGSGVVEVIQKNNEMVNKKADEEICVKYVLDLRDFPGQPVEKILVHDYNIIVEDKDVSIICETMGGVNPAYEFTKRALLAGKSVCTSNKELVANHGPELLRIAKEHHCNYMFEASVGGGIPIIRPLNYCVTPEKIEKITGILNGTTNYILSKMASDGADFADVLKEAQEKGYAEKNPEADVEGYDACRKIAILTSLMCGKTIDYKDIYTEGITKITALDFLYAKQMKKSIKLFAVSEEVDNKIYAFVAPFMIGKEHPLFSVKDVFNGILVRGNMLGDTMYYGRGAGKLPTASAVVSDVVDCVRHLGKTVMCFWDEEKVQLSPMDERENVFFVRVKGKPEDSLSEIKESFGDVKIVEVQGVTDEYGFLTKKIKEKDFETALGRIDGVITRIRVEE